MTEITQVIQLYKEGKISQYVFEREVALYLGGQTEVSVEQGKNTTASFVVMPLVRQKSTGLMIQYVIDKFALMNLYSPEELGDVLETVRTYRQQILKEFTDFLTEAREKEVSRGDAVAMVLSTYRIIYTALRKKNDKFLPNEDELNDVIYKIREGYLTRELIEEILVKGYLPESAISYADSLRKEAPEGAVKVKFVNPGRETPEFNLGQQAIRKLAHPTLGDERHHEIPYDYLPKTNQ